MRIGRLLLAAWTCLCLTACQLANVRSPLASGTDAATGGATQGSNEAQTIAAGAVPPITGQVKWPAGFGVQTTTPSNYASAGATLALIDQSDNVTVATGLTDASGNFSLSLGSFTPPTGNFYVLEAMHGLDNNTAGNQVARFRTLMKWTGSAWTSISGPLPLYLTSQTTAIALLNSLDSTNVPFASTLNTVSSSGTTVALSPDPAVYPISQIDSMAAAILYYLTNTTDPVQDITRLSPTIHPMQPTSPEPGGYALIPGDGFSPVLASYANGTAAVLFGTATASVLFASPTEIDVQVPANAPSSGNLVVVTPTSTSSAYSYTLAAAGGAAPNPSLSTISATSGTAGSSLTVTGSNFDTQGASSEVIFNQVASPLITSWSSGQAIVNVPGPTTAGHVTGPVKVQTRQGLQSPFFNSYTANASLNEPFLNTSHWDATDSSNVVWTPNGNDALIPYDGNLTVSGAVTPNPARSLFAASANQGATTIFLNDAAGFSVGQELFLVQLYGTGAGYWEFNIVTAVNGNILSLQYPTAHAYTIGSALAQKVLHYGTVTINAGGVLQGPSVANEGLTGGFLIMRADTLTMNGGSISMNGAGGLGGGGGTAGSGTYNANTSIYLGGGGGNGGGGYANGAASTGPLSG
ncbi:MAG: IPT/TIG domain-containing protein, partial [Cyanobacteria bacterium REEB65]|nr:IPT/TIG domain-containing protein [Cyanobacteria bacterium REEB65]